MRRLKIWKRRFRFCRRDEYGIRPRRGCPGEFVRATPLGLELTLRTDLRIITETYYKIPGIHGWNEYKRNLPEIRAHVAAIAAALRRYKARSVERGLFHFVPRANSVGFRILSPLRAPPGARREVLLHKWRRQRKKRAAAAAALAALLKKKPTDQACALKTGITMRPSAMLYLVYLVSVSVLSCMIVFL